MFLPALVRSELNPLYVHCCHLIISYPLYNSTLDVLQARPSLTDLAPKLTQPPNCCEFHLMLRQLGALSSGVVSPFWVPCVT